MPEPGIPTQCPSCAGELIPRRFECRDCHTRVELPGTGNEFTELEPEMLHLLRIFVLCEGRIRDMEAALGVSYPTVKSRLGKLRSALGLAGSESRSAGTSPPPANKAATESAAADNDSDNDDDKENVAQILSLLEKGEIDYPTALARIRSVRA